MTQALLYIAPFLLFSKAWSQSPLVCRYTIVGVKNPAGNIQAAAGSVVISLPRFIINLNNESCFFVAYTATGRALTTDSRLTAYQWHGFFSSNSEAHEATLLLILQQHNIWLRIKSPGKNQLFLLLRDERPFKNFNNRFKLFEKQTSNTDKHPKAANVNQNVNKNRHNLAPPYAYFVYFNKPLIVPKHINLVQQT